MDGRFPQSGTPARFPLSGQCVYVLGVFCNSPVCFIQPNMHCIKPNVYRV